MRKSDLTLSLRATVLGALLSSTSVPAHADDGVKGDSSAGKRHYAVCSACHGPHAEGNRTLDAPALAGREAWYLLRQIASFRSGIRGAHPDDRAGQQMRAMALVLPDEQSMRDVVAYVSSLEPTNNRKKEGAE